METKTFAVHADNLETIDTKLSYLVRTAKKLGIPPIVWRVTRRWEETEKSSLGIEEVTKWAEIEVVGTRPKLNGWIFAGTIEHTSAGNIMRMAIGEEAPVQFRTTSRVCGHCGTKRYRNDTYLVKNEDTAEWRQVGSSCLKDFTGHPSPDTLISYCEAWDALDFSEQEGGYTEERYVTGIILNLTACAVRTYGWKSSREAQETLTASTKDVVLTTLYPPKNSHDHEPLKPTAEDIEHATSALAWAKDLDESARSSEYLQNLWVLSNLPSVTRRDLGLLVSLIAAYDKEMLERTRRAELGTSTYQGEVGDKLTVWVKYIGQRVFDGRYGPVHMIEFRDKQGNSYVWWTGSGIGEVTPGQVFTVKGTVKEHREYKGEYQTVLTRCKVQGE